MFIETLDVILDVEGSWTQPFKDLEALASSFPRKQNLQPPRSSKHRDHERLNFRAEQDGRKQRVSMSGVRLFFLFFAWVSIAFSVASSTFLLFFLIKHVVFLFFFSRFV